MIGSPLAAGVAKVAAVGILMAAGAGGIYIVSRTGDPGAGNPRFTFDPVPVITLTNGTPVFVDPDQGCGSYFPDRVSVLVAHESLTAVEEWIDEVGFEVLERTENKRNVILYVRVPFGASPDASRALAEREGVLGAGPDGTIEGPTPCTLGP